jgi:hypothetical protein
VTDAPKDLMPDSAVSLSIRFPLVLPKRVPGAYVVRGWSLDTGETVIDKVMTSEGMEGPILTTAFLTHPMPGILVAAWDGDDGKLLNVRMMRLDADQDRGEHGIPAELWERMQNAKGDPDALCTICDPDAPDGAELDPATIHPECYLMNTIGPLGVHLDRSFWLDNMGDPYAGRAPREGALKLYELVKQYGFVAVLLGAAHSTDHEGA